MPNVGSVLTVFPARYNNEYFYSLTGTTTYFSSSELEISGGSSDDGAYVGFAVCWLNLVNPAINRVITAYNGTTKRATLSQSGWSENFGLSPVGVAPTVGVSIWGLCNNYPVDRRYQWIKDGSDIPGAIGASFTPYAPGSYQVRETAFFPSYWQDTSGPTTSTLSAATTITGTRDSTLVYSDNLVWEGCFYAPATSPDQLNSFGPGGAIAYYAAGNENAGSLFVCGDSQKIGEISIPTPSKTLGSVPTANLLNTAGLVDPIEGQRVTSGITSADDGVVISGLLVDNGKLIVSAHGSYQQGNKASWFWRRPLNLSTAGSVEGPFAVTDSAFRDNPRCYAGYMASVPLALQTKLGGPVVAGLAAQSVVSNTSDGPTFASFNPANFTSAASNVKRGSYVAASSNKMTLSSGASMSSTTDFYVGYWLATQDGTSEARKVTAYNGATKEATVSENWAPGRTNSSWILIPPVSAKSLSMYLNGELQVSDNTPKFTNIWDWACSPIGGYAIPNGTRSVLAFAAAGNNLYMYSSPGQVRYGVKCYADPSSGTGETNYPYFSRCWAYDANELEQARLNNVSPGSLKPYAVWNFQEPILDNGRISGAAYDPVGRRLFLTNFAGPSNRIVIHVYSVSNATS
jgi:hypothetical protein